MPFVQTPNLNIHYEIAGKGEISLIFVHGNFASWRWWRLSLENLPARYKAYAPDLRGCGDTSRPDTGYTITQLTADLQEFSTVLNLAPFHLVGHSLGGAVAVQFALNSPRQVRSLTLVAPPPPDGMPIFPTSKKGFSWISRLIEQEKYASLASLDKVYRLLQSLDANRPLLRRALKRMMPTYEYGASFEALVDDAARVAPGAVVGFVETLDAWNVQSELAGFPLPVLILGGERDMLISPRTLERTRKQFPNVQLVIWPEVGHTPQLEQPERFQKTLLSFIEEIEKPGWAHSLSRLRRGWRLWQDRLESH